MAGAVEGKVALVTGASGGIGRATWASRSNGTGSNGVGHR